MSSESGTLRFYTSVGLDSALESIKKFAGSADAILIQCQTVASHQDATHSRDWEYGGPKPDLKLSDDGEAAVQIHSYLGNMDADQAADRRLWSYLAAVEFPDYTRRRWSSQSKTIGDNWATDRVLIAKSNLTRLSRNSIARLWHAANILKDDTLDWPLSARARDPYAYTRAVLAKQDRHTALFQRTMVYNPILLRAVIDHLESVQVNRESVYIQALAKEIYLRMGFQRLEVLSYDEVTDFVNSAGSHLQV